jgi:heat shock protein HtpX
VRIMVAFATLVGGAAGIDWLVTGALGAVIAGVSALLACASLYRCASRCVLQLAGAYPFASDVAPGLHRLVERLAVQSGTPPQKARDSAGATVRLYWLPGAAPNVLATGRDPAHAAIALTPDLPALLDHDELAALLARELACLARGDTQRGDIAAALAGGLMLIARGPVRSQHSGQSDAQDRNVAVRRSASRQGVGTGWRLVMASIAAGVVRAASSAERIHAADAAGALMVGDPLPLARALAKLTAANSTRPAHEVNPGLAHLFVVTPYIEESLQLLFSTPPSSSARLQRLTRQALQPVVNPG